MISSCLFSSLFFSLLSPLTFSTVTGKTRFRVLCECNVHENYAMFEWIDCSCVCWIFIPPHSRLQWNKRDRNQFHLLDYCISFVLRFVMNGSKTKIDELTGKYLASPQFFRKSRTLKLLEQNFLSISVFAIKYSGSGKYSDSSY